MAASSANYDNRNATTRQILCETLDENEFCWNSYVGMCGRVLVMEMVAIGVFNLFKAAKS